MQYDKELQKLQESTGKAVLEKSDETAQSKGTFQKDKEAFEQKYLELNAENEELKIEKGKLQTELNSIKSELEVTKSKLNKLQEQFQQVQNSLISANEQISSLIYRNQELCRKLEERGGEC